MKVADALSIAKTLDTAAKAAVRNHVDTKEAHKADLSGLDELVATMESVATTLGQIEPPEPEAGKAPDQFEATLATTANPGDHVLTLKSDRAPAKGDKLVAVGLQDGTTVTDVDAEAGTVTLSEPVGAGMLSGESVAVLAA